MNPGERGADTAGGPLPRASVPDALRIAAGVALPWIAEGVTARRRAVVRLSAALGLQDRSGELLRRMRERYGDGPLLVRLPGLRLAYVLSPHDVRRVFTEPAHLLTPAAPMKREALGHFEPTAVLVSSADRRAARRRVNDLVLDSDRPEHREAGAFLTGVAQEVAALSARLDRTGRLTWEEFSPCCWRIARRVVLGSGAVEDHELTELLAALRRSGNWMAAGRRRRRTHRAFTARLREHLDRAEPGSLAAIARSAHAPAEADPDGQVPHWLFGFDAAARAAIRALALLGSHRAELDLMRAELAEHGPRDVLALTRLRATVLESVRLWPIIPSVVRRVGDDLDWRGGKLPAGTNVVVSSPYFHRDERVLAQPDRFHPEVWLDGRGEEQWALLPFSRGGSRCPGENLVLLTTTAILADLLRRHDFRLTHPRLLGPVAPLPGSLDHFRLRFDVRPVDPRREPRPS
ncbi:cytochrome P450 [Saccharothrix algeriensis]|uniref:Cytochrome P450 n=1 Tax=Saccharothrix algeriensis TaxID=173560 RepID=A0A8T8HXA5_9PSEU|nr:cytochrome P450 [Saccharothrix algeriensis]MBM7814785.1 cytochrome P450 [Saccharothrix algeriensis]QTR03057.1 cytochrome P450 [Saccharothrix algeriensis]